MKKEFITNIFFLLLINLIIKPLYIFGIESQVQQKVGDEAFGLYFSMYGLVFLHQFINDPGLQNFNSIFVAQNRSDIGSHLPRLLGLKLQLLILMLVSITLSAWVLQYKTSDYVLLISIILVLFLSSLFVLLRTSLSSLGSYHFDTWLSGVDRLLLVVVLTAILWYGNAFTIQGFVGIQVMVYTACVLVVLAILRSRNIAILPVFDIQYNIGLLKKCLPYALIILLTAIIMRADGVIIERWLEDGSRQAGIYAKGYRFMDAANMFGYLFGALLLPMYAHKMDDKKETGELFHLAHNLLLYLSIFIGSSFYIFKSEIFHLLYKDMADQDIHSLMPLMWAIIPVAMTNVYGPMILAAHKTRAYNTVFIIGVLIYLVSNFYFVPKYGILAASYTALFTWSILLIGMIIIVIKDQLMGINKTLILHSLLIIFIVGGSFFLIGRLDLTWLLQLCTVGIFSSLLMVLTGIIKLKTLLKS